MFNSEKSRIYNSGDGLGLGLGVETPSPPACESDDWAIAPRLLPTYSAYCRTARLRLRSSLFAPRYQAAPPTRPSPILPLPCSLRLQGERRIITARLHITTAATFYMYVPQI
jgi:hypothetical protein